MQHGHGKFIRANGSILEGVFKHDQFVATHDHDRDNEQGEHETQTLNAEEEEEEAAPNVIAGGHVNTLVSSGTATFDIDVDDILLCVSEDDLEQEKYEISKLALRNIGVFYLDVYTFVCVIVLLSTAFPHAPRNKDGHTTRYFLVIY